MIPRITQAQMAELLDHDSLYECIGNKEKLNESQSDVLTAVFQHAATVFNKSEKDHYDFKMLQGAFPWSGLVSRDVAAEWIEAVPDHWKKDLIGARVKSTNTDLFKYYCIIWKVTPPESKPPLKVSPLYDVFLMGKTKYVVETPFLKVSPRLH